MEFDPSKWAELYGPVGLLCAVFGPIFYSFLKRVTDRHITFVDSISDTNEKLSMAVVGIEECLKEMRSDQKSHMDICRKHNTTSHV